MRTLAIVPARAGSVRLPGKNTEPLGGVPLAERAIRTALASERVDHVVVSSDDDAVLALAAKIDPALALPRPAELATATSMAIDLIVHALDATAQAGPFDAVVLLQPTSPFTEPGDVDACVELLERSGADSVVTVAPLDHTCHPVKVKRLEGDRLVPYLEAEDGRMAAHELPALFVRNCSVYVSRRAVHDAGLTIGADCRAVVMPRLRSVDINDDLDLAFAEFLWATRLGPDAPGPPPP